MSVPKLPPYPIGELATWQLRDYRTALETALPKAAAGSADAILIRRRFDEVLAEQRDRTKGCEDFG